MGNCKKLGENNNKGGESRGASCLMRLEKITGKGDIICRL